MSLPRLYAPTLSAGVPEFALPSDEAAHARRVLRLGAGDPLRAFDGRGFEVEARIIEASRDVVRCRVEHPVTAEREGRVAITVAQSVLKLNRLDAVVRDATSLGMSAWQPVVSARSIVSRAALDHGHYLERWRRVAISAAKQCGRAVIPEILVPCTHEEIVTKQTDALRLVLAEPASAAPPADPSRFARAPERCIVLVGPEGGWTDDELVLACDRGWHPWRIGRRTLRADLAAVVALSALQFLWDRD